MIFNLLQNLWIYGTVGRRIFMLALMLMTMSVVAHEGVPINMKEIDDENGYSPTPSNEPWELPYETEPTNPPDTTDTNSIPYPTESDNPRDRDCSTPVTGPCLNVRLCSCW